MSVQRHQRAGELARPRDLDRPPGQLLAHPAPRARRAGRRRRGRRAPARRAPASRTSAPEGRSAIGETDVGVPRAPVGPSPPPGAGARDVVGLVVERARPRLAGDAAGLLGRPRISPEYEVRRQARSIGAARSAAPRAAVGGGGTAGGAGAAGRLARRVGPPAASQARKQRRRRSSVAGAGHPVGHRGLAGPATAQQPGQPAVGLVPRRRPPGHDLGLGAGERDVGQPDVVAGHLGAAAGLDVARARAAGRRCRGSAGRPRGGSTTLRGPGRGG